MSFTIGTPSLRPTTIAVPPPKPMLEIGTLTGAPWTNPAADISAYTDPMVGPYGGGGKYGSNDDYWWEWYSILDSDRFDPQAELLEGTAVSGVAVNCGQSDRDNPILHPFGGDFEYYVVPDPQYGSLLGSSNNPPPAPSGLYSAVYQKAIAAARARGLNVSQGVIGVEIDGGFIPSDYRAAEGDRVAVYGRWIVDAGHNDFHTEIHPPLLSAFARMTDTNLTTFRLIGRPFLVSQIYTTDDGPPGSRESLRRLIKRSVVSFANVFGGTDVRCGPTVFGDPANSGPNRQGSFQGIHMVSFVVRPPGPRPSPRSLLTISYHFTVRDGVGVNVMTQGDDSVLVTVVLNSAVYPPVVAPRLNWVSATPADLIASAGVDASGFAVDVLETLNQDKPIFFYQYDPMPPATSSADTTNVVENAIGNAVNGTRGFAVDNSQPYPIYGWLGVRWQDTLVSTPTSIQTRI